MKTAGAMKTNEINYVFNNRVIKTIVMLVILAVNIPLKAQEAFHGFVHGDLAVSPTGGATYAIPIEMPPGVGDMQPQITIMYNSQSGMGLAGWCCNLTGYTMITRGSKDIFHDGTAKGMSYGLDDAFYLDGKRLILSSGTDGQPNCIYKPEGDPYTTVKVLGSYTGVADNRSFEVRTPDGLTTIYGNTPGTRQGFEINDTSRIAAWYIHTVTDTLGNALEWQYSKDQFFVYPTKVTYGICSVEFSYTTLGSAARPFKLMSVSGMMNKRLTEIRCKSGSTTVRRYSLTYETISDQTMVKFPKLSQVKVYDGNGQQLRPLTMEWEGISDYDLSQSTCSIADRIVPNNFVLTDRQLYPGDLNGDGLYDIIEISTCESPDNDKYSYLGIHRSNSTQLYTFSNTSAISIPNEFFLVPLRLRSNCFGDFNGDGLQDFAVIYYTNTYWNGASISINTIYGDRSLPGNIAFSDTITIQMLRDSDEMPPFAIADIDNDGKSEIIVLERVYNHSYNYHVVYFGSNRSYIVEHKYLDLSVEPRRLFIEDFNGDGLKDMMVMGTDSYDLHWNRLGKSAQPYPHSSFHDDEPIKVTGTDVTDAYRVQTGDFNGDGLPDFLINYEDNWNYYFALNNGDGTFNKILAGQLSIHDEAKDEDNIRFTVMVDDFDHDGMSDVFIAHSKYEHHGGLNPHNEYKYTDIHWYRSTGSGLSLIKSARTGNEDDALFGRISLGDFDGDGYHEFINYGSSITANTTSWDSLKIRFYHEDNVVPSRKLTSVTDGLGNKITLGYASLTNSQVYERGNDESYPMADICMPLHVLRTVQQTTGATTNYSSRMTDTYSYGGLKVHVAGRGMLGFSELSVSNDITGITTSTIMGGWNSDNRYTPTFLNETKKLADNSTSTMHTATGFHPIFDSLNYFTSKDTVIVTDFDGNTETTEYHYDLGKGVLTRQRTYPDGNSTLMYKETEFGSFVKKAGQWLPRMIYTRQKHKDDPLAFQTIKKIAYNDFGLPDTVVVNYGTPLALTKAYTYDEYGNPLSETVSGSGLNTVTTNYEYDSTNRFVTRKSTTPSSTVEEKTYNTWGSELTKTDMTDSSNPLTTINEYDGFGNLTKSTSPEGVITNVSYYWGNDATHRYYVHEEPEGKPWKKTWFDSKGRETEIRTIGFNDIPFYKYNYYDEKGNLVYKKTENWSTATEEWIDYDYRGRITKDSLFTGGNTTYVYGNRQVTETKNGRSTQTKFDEWNNVKRVQDPISSVTYTYKSNGKPARASTGNGIVLMNYDECGNQVSLVDPDAGTMTYMYNASGQVISQTDARGITTTHTLDSLNRVVRTSTGNTVVNYIYGTTGNSSQRLTGISTPTHGIYYTYDRYGRVTSETRNYGSMQYVFNHTYSRLGRHTRTVYPGDVTVDYGYDLNGFCEQMKVNGNRVWYISDYDYYANGNDLYVIDSLGTGQNGLARTTRYDDYGNLSTIVMTRQNSTLNAMTFYHNRFTGNLMSRSGMLQSEGELFTYDSLDRLIRYQNNNGHWDDIYQYTHDGNIQYRTGIGYYDYQPTSGVRPHAVKRVDNTSGRISTDDNYVTYNDIGKASRIEENHAAIRYDIVYGPDGERWESSLYKTNYQWPDTVRRYVGNMEIVTQGPSEVCRFYYLGHGVILRKVNNTVTPLYAFTDNLGSITRLYTENGTVKFKAQYDPWGVQKVIKNDINFARGYCGHEMLNWFQLINMNGRLYDPMLGRFLSPDNYVQMPTSSQSFNRYSYCLNNPFKYVDVDGENPLVVIGVIVGAYLGGSLANNKELNPFQWDFKSVSTYLGIGVGALIGGVSGFALTHPGTYSFVFNAMTPWTSSGITLSADAGIIGFSSKWKFDFHWTTKAGGGGTTEYSKKKLDKKTSDIYDEAVNRMKYYYYNLHEIENSINTMTNSFIEYGKGKIQQFSDNLNDKYLKRIDFLFRFSDVISEETNKEKIRKGFISFGEYYGSKYTGKIVGDLAVFAVSSSGYGIPFSATAGAMGYAIGATMGAEVGGYSMASLFDLMDFGFQSYRTVRKMQSSMRWIDQQNIILQKQYYYNNYNIWY